MYACLSVGAHISKTTRLNYTIFVHLLSAAVALPSSDDDIAIRYVLTVLWMK